MAKIALCDARGTLNHLNDNLAGEKGDEWLSALKRFLNRENPWPMAAIAPWRTVTLGLHKTPAAYRAALKKVGFRTGDYAEGILNKVLVAKQRCDVVLVRCSVADLGFTSKTRYDVICARAKELGLELCPAEVGPALRLAYADQETGDWFRIAMEPLVGRARVESVFDLGHIDDSRWLSTSHGFPGVEWSPVQRFVFRRSSASISP